MDLMTTVIDRAIDLGAAEALHDDALARLAAEQEQAEAAGLGTTPALRAAKRDVRRATKGARRAMRAYRTAVEQAARSGYAVGTITFD